MKNKFKKILISIGSMAMVTAPITAVISCGNNSTKTGASDIKTAQVILSKQLASQDLAIGKDNSEDYNKHVAEATEKSETIIDGYNQPVEASTEDIKTISISATAGEWPSLQQVWYKYLPKAKTKSDSEQSWNKFIDGAASSMVPDASKEDAWKEEQKSFFEKEFWNQALEKTPSNKLDNIGSLSKWGTAFPAHADSAFIQLAWASFKNENKDLSTQTEKESAAKQFIFNINQNTNQRMFTVPGVTGAGQGWDEYHVLRGYFDNSLMPVLKAYAVEPNLNATDADAAFKAKVLEDPSAEKLTFKTWGNLKYKSIISDVLTDWTSNIYYEGQMEYDNWYDYEVNAISELVNAMMVISSSPLGTKINDWMAPYRYFAEDPLYQHAAATSIYNSVPAVKTMNTGANLADYVNSSLKADLLMGSMSLAKRDTASLYNHLWKNFTPTYNDGYKRDGGFIQHNVMPFQAHYGGITLETTLNIQKQIEGTELDLFKSFKGMQNVFTVIRDTYMPLYFRGALPDTTNGRFLGTTNGGNTLKRGIQILSAIDGLLKYANEGEVKTLLRNWVNSQIRELLEDYNDSKTTDFTDIDDYLAKNVWGGSSALLTPGLSGINFKSMFENTDFQHLSANYDGYKKIGNGDGTKQIFSNDILNINKFGKEGDQSWQFDSRYHDMRVGLYEAQTAENQQGMYMGDGMYTVRTENDPNMYSAQYWSSIDAYHLPGTVSFRLPEIPDPDVYYVPGYSVKTEEELKKAIPEDFSGQEISNIHSSKLHKWKLEGIADEIDVLDREDYPSIDGSPSLKDGQELLRNPNEWIAAKTAAWNTIINGAKTDATGPGYTGGTNKDGFTNTMSQFNSWDGRVSTQRSTINLDGMILVVGHSDSQKDGMNLTIDNRWDNNPTSKEKFTNTPAIPASKDAAESPSAWEYSNDETSKDTEKVSYVMVDGEAKQLDEHVDYEAGTSSTFAQKHAAKWWRQEADYKSGAVPTEKLEGTHHELNMDISNKDTFAYTIAPNMTADQAINAYKDANIEIIRNDQYAQIISYEKTNEDGKKTQYLFANIFQNNNFSTSVAWADPTAPMILTSSKAASMIFKRHEYLDVDQKNKDIADVKAGKVLTKITDSNGDVLPADRSLKASKGQITFDVVTQDAEFDTTSTRLGFGKTISELSQPFGKYTIVKEQDIPHYWTDKQQAYQNGPYVDDRRMTDDEFWREKFSRSYVLFARDSLDKVGKYFYRPDQLDLYQDEKFQIQDEHSFSITFKGYEGQDIK